VLAFEHTLARSALSPRRHYFDIPPIDCVHLLIISIGSGKTIVVFFSTYLGEGLEVAQLDGRGLRLKNLGGIGKLCEASNSPCA